MSTTTDHIDIYTNLGFLFYSVAAGDGYVREEEIEALKRLVMEQWMPLEGSRDEFGVDAAEYITMAFDYARDNRLDAQQTSLRFEAAYREHQRRFDPALKRLVLDTAAAIANAFGHTNKAEFAALTQLQTLFREPA